MKRQFLSFVWIIGIPITIWGLFHGLLLVLSVKLPNYPSHPRIRTSLLVSWLIITMIELVLAILSVIFIFGFAIIIGKHICHVICNYLKSAKDFKVMEKV